MGAPRRLPPDAFDAWVALGVGRTYGEVARQFGVSERTIERHARAERWQERRTRIEERARETSDAKLVDAVAEMSARHIAAAQLMLDRALERFQAGSIEKTRDAIRALDVATRIERLALGQPTASADLSFAERTRREYADWLTLNEAGWSDENAEPEAGPE